MIRISWSIAANLHQSLQFFLLKDLKGIGGVDSGDALTIIMADREDIIAIGTTEGTSVMTGGEAGGPRGGISEETGETMVVIEGIMGERGGTLEGIGGMLEMTGGNLERGENSEVIEGNLEVIGGTLEGKGETIGVKEENMEVRGVTMEVRGVTMEVKGGNTEGRGKTLKGTEETNEGNLVEGETKSTEMIGEVRRGLTQGILRTTGAVERAITKGFHYPSHLIMIKSRLYIKVSFHKLLFCMLAIYTTLYSSMEQDLVLADWLF